MYTVDNLTGALKITQKSAWVGHSVLKRKLIHTLNSNLVPSYI